MVEGEEEVEEQPGLLDNRDKNKKKQCERRTLVISGHSQRQQELAAQRYRVTLVFNPQIGPMRVTQRLYYFLMLLSSQIKKTVSILISALNAPKLSRVNRSTVILSCFVY